MKKKKTSRPKTIGLKIGRKENPMSIGEESR